MLMLLSYPGRLVGKRGGFAYRGLNQPCNEPPLADKAWARTVLQRLMSSSAARPREAVALGG
jgi:hypothetical protein